MKLPLYERNNSIAPINIPQIQPNPPISDNGQHVGKTLEGVFGRLQEIQNGIEDARTLELFNKFKMDSQEYHEDPNKGIYNTRFGYKSYGIYKEADEWLRKKGEDYAQELPSRRAQANFRKMAREHIEQRGLQNSRFEADQVRKYEQETADYSIKNSLIYAEQNWNNPEAIEQARRDIQQALELKMRGSGVEAFENAYAEIEDQLGVARIRQAFAQHPLDALEMLNNPDIHLKPETFAKLKKSLTDSTEVYELQAIASSYAQVYTQNNAVEARRKLIERYGADKGEKAFSALSHIWSVANAQKTSREKDKQEAQQAHEEELLRRFNDPNQTDPTPENIISLQKNRTITPRFAMYALGLIQQKEAQNARNLQAQTKAIQDKNDLELWSMERRGEFRSNEELDQLVRGGLLEKSNADRHIARREEYARQKEQAEKKRLEQNMQDFITKFLNGSLSNEEIDEAVENLNLKPNDALTLKEHLRSDAERRDRENNQALARNKESIKQAQKNMKGALRIIINNGGIIRHDMATRLFNEGKIDQDTLQMLYNHEDQFNAEQERLRIAAEKESAAKAKEQATEKTKAEKEQHKNELDKRAQQLADLAWDSYGGESGAMLDQIAKMDLPLEDREFLRKQFLQHFATKEQRAKDAKAPLEKAIEEAFNNTWLDIMQNVNTQDEINSTRKSLIEQREILGRDKYNELISILDKKERINKEIANLERKARNNDIAKEYASKFSLGHEQDAYSEIREKYGQDADDIIRSYDRLIQEQKTARSNEEKALALQQDNTFNNLLNTYTRKGMHIPVQTIQQLEQSKGLRQEQIDRAYALNSGLDTKQGMENNLSKYYEGWADLSPTEKEALVMQAMGTSPEKRKENFSLLYNKVVDGTLSNAEIEHYRTYGMIADADAENLKEYDAKFDRQQKGRIMAAKNTLIQEIRSMTDGDSETSKILTNALLEFSLATINLDTKAKNFDDVVKGIYESVKQNAVDSYTKGKSLTERKFWRWPPFSSAPSPLGIRINSMLNNTENFSLPQINQSIPYMDEQGNTHMISPQGEIQSFDNTVPIPLPQNRPAPESPPAITIPENVFQNDLDWGALQLEGVKLESQLDGTNSSDIQTTRNTWSGIVDSVKSILKDISYSISSGFSSTPTALRDGRGHLAIDAAVPTGTLVRVPEFGGNWTVSKTGEDATAGKFVKIKNTLSGDVYEYTFAHLSSIDVASGDTVSSADVIAKSGNTGNSTGAHLHIGLKINGKAVDPRSVNLGNGVSQDIPPQPAPQPLVPPKIMSEEEAYNEALDFLGLRNNPLWGDISGDISTNTLWGGQF